MMMKRSFNETGVCIPKEHYMVDISNKISKIFGMVERGQYFVINRPRQYGKTTTIDILRKKLESSDDFFPIEMSFESIWEDAFKSESLFIERFFFRLKKSFNTSSRDDLINYLETLPSVLNFDALDILVSELVVKIGKKVVLMIDEVDKSSDNQLFLAFLGFLRNKYLNRHKKGQSTFHSVILVGVHNAKNLKLKLRPESEAKYNSPWNIAAEFNVDMSFNPLEISTMLKDYMNETRIEMDIESISQQLYYYTSGYPFLVSKLCKIIDEEILPEENRKQWNTIDIEQAVNRLLKTQPTNFESVVKNLENNKELYEVVEKITLKDEKFEFNIHDCIVDLGVTYGIFKIGGPHILIHNRIYKEIIYNYMASVFKRKTVLSTGTEDYSFEANYLDKNDSLDFEKVLLKFQEFMKKEYSKRDEAFLERNGRLIFLAFLKPIINGNGYDFKESQASEEKRMDVIVTYREKKFIVELKIWRGKKAHEKGIQQLSQYLETQGLEKGYLIIFDFTKKTGKTFKKSRINSEQKKIFAVWV